MRGDHSYIGAKELELFWMMTPRIFHALGWVGRGGARQHEPSLKGKEMDMVLGFGEFNSGENSKLPWVAMVT